MFEGENEHEMCEVSVEHKEGRKAVSILIDSGGSDSVAPPGMFPQIKVLETDASKAGMEYTAAGGHTIKNLGATRPLLHTKEGERMIMTFQVAEVTKILASVSRVVSNGHRVVFDRPEVGSYVEHKASGKRIMLRQSNGFTYWMFGWRRIRVRARISKGRFDDDAAFEDLKSNP